MTWATDNLSVDDYLSCGDRFWKKVDKTDECWLWTAWITAKGYGAISLKNHMTPAHRVAYVLEHATLVPPDKCLDHLCRVRSCVNPDHLEVVTKEENTHRGFGVAAVNGRKTECKYGHLLSGENVYFVPAGRQCRECHRKASRDFMRYLRQKRKDIAT